MRTKEKTPADQFRRQNEFIKNNYDRYSLTMPKGKKKIVVAAAERAGVSVNEFINAAIDEKMKGDQNNVR